MPRRMTVIFDEDEIYVALKAQSAREGRPAKDIVAEAVREWLERKEDEALQKDLEATREEWRRKGGVEAQAFFQSLAKETGQ